MLELYHDYKHGLLPKKDLLVAVRLTESYIFRRAVCGIAANSMRRTFATFIQGIKKEQYLVSIQSKFARLLESRRFPTDSEFKREIKVRDLYQIRSGAYWLRRLENHGRREHALVDDYTIEHILPQNPKLSAAWKEALGPEWQRIQRTWLHTLGNLTLTGYNQSYKDSAFPIKRDLEKGGNDIGFRYSPLKLNKGLGQVEVWSEQAIQDRAEVLANLALKVWTMPTIDDDFWADAPNELKYTKSSTLAAQPQLV